MDQKDKLKTIFKQHGYSDFRWIEPRKIVVSHWVRMKCQFGCDEYGITACCPPNVPSVSECEKFFYEYRTAAIFHFAKKVEEPEKRWAWTRKINGQLLKLEREVFISGYQKAFLLFLGSCNFCESCPGEKSECKQPKMARPTPEALAMDVYATVRQVGYPIQVLADLSQEMNRYAFLLVE